MKRLLLAAALALVCLPTLSLLAAEDFSGKWSGTFSGVGPGGQQTTENILMDLVHKGADLSGTAGPNAERQWKILKGKVEGDKLTFEVQAGGDTPGGPVLRFALALADGHLKGDVNAEFDGQKLTAKLDATRVK